MCINTYPQGEEGQFFVASTVGSKDGGQVLIDCSNLRGDLLLSLVYPV